MRGRKPLAPGRRRAPGLASPKSSTLPATDKHHLPVSKKCAGPVPSLQFYQVPHKTWIMALMSDYRAIEQKIQGILGSSRRPVAVTFLEAPPDGVAKFSGSMPSSCSFWRIAGAGSTFYTVASDHLNCPVGGYTHNTLPPDRMPELQQTLSLMSDIGYIRMEEIPGVFHLSTTPQVVLYSPLGDTPVPPSVVLATGRPGRVMMLSEAANLARKSVVQGKS